MNKLCTQYSLFGMFELFLLYFDHTSIDTSKHIIWWYSTLYIPVVLADLMYTTLFSFLTCFICVALNKCTFLKLTERCFPPKNTQLQQVSPIQDLACGARRTLDSIAKKTGPSDVVSLAADRKCNHAGIVTCRHPATIRRHPCCNQPWWKSGWDRIRENR